MIVCMVFLFLIVYGKWRERMKVSRLHHHIICFIIPCCVVDIWFYIALWLSFIAIFFENNLLILFFQLMNDIVDLLFRINRNLFFSIFWMKNCAKRYQRRVVNSLIVHFYTVWGTYEIKSLSLSFRSKWPKWFVKRETGVNHCFMDNILHYLVAP